MQSLRMDPVVAEAVVSPFIVRRYPIISPAQAAIVVVAAPPIVQRPPAQAVAARVVVLVAEV